MVDLADDRAGDPSRSGSTALRAEEDGLTPLRCGCTSAFFRVVLGVVVLPRFFGVSALFLSSVSLFVGRRFGVPGVSSLERALSDTLRAVRFDWRLRIHGVVYLSPRRPDPITRELEWGPGTILLHGHPDG